MGFGQQLLQEGGLDRGEVNLDGGEPLTPPHLRAHVRVSIDCVHDAVDVEHHIHLPRRPERRKDAAIDPE